MVLGDQRLCAKNSNMVDKHENSVSNLQLGNGHLKKILLKKYIRLEAVQYKHVKKFPQPKANFSFMR